MKLLLGLDNLKISSFCPNFNLVIFQLILFATIFLAFVTCFLLIVVEIDKKIKFHKVLGLEYMMTMKNYSNTEFLIKSWIMVIMMFVGFFVAFFQAIYNLGTVETKIVGSEQMYQNVHKSL